MHLKANFFPNSLEENFQEQEKAPTYDSETDEQPSMSSRLKSSLHNESNEQSTKHNETSNVDRNEQPNSTSSNVQMLQQQIMNQLIAKNSNSSDNIKNEDLLQDRQMSKSNPLSLLDDNLSFNFNSIVSSPPPPTSSSSSDTHLLFSSLTGQLQRSQQTFDSSLGGLVRQSDPLHAPHHVLGLMQSKNDTNDVATEKASTHEKDPSDGWLYRDPQGKIQGPFSSNEMFDWYANGYFTVDLLVKRIPDDKFIKLGDLIQNCNGVPFSSSPPQQPTTAFPFSGQNEPTSGSSLFFPSSLPNAALNQSQQPPVTPHGSMPLMPSMMSNAARFLPQTPASAPILSQAPGGSFGSMLEDLAQSTNSLNQMNSALFGNGSSAKDGGLMSNNSMLNNPMQRQNQLHTTGPMMHGGNNIMPPQINTVDAQRRALLNHLIKNEHFMQMSPQQREMILMEKLAQLNVINASNTNLPSTEQSFSGPIGRPSTDLESFQKTKFEEHQHKLKKLSLEEPNPHLIQQQQTKHIPSSQAFDMTHFVPQQPQQAPPVQHHTKPIDIQSAAKPQPIQPPIQPAKNNAMDFIQSALQGNIQNAAVSTANSLGAWKNIVPGALSLSAVEELQRREAEERYRLQQKEAENDQPRFIQLDDLESKVQTKQKTQQQQATSLPHHQQEGKPQSMKSTQVISKPTPTEVLDVHNSHKQLQQTQQQLPTQAVLPQMPQLPKKSVWGNPSQSIETTVNQQQQPLSIAEIQKLQEEKEREEEEHRQRAIQQQMATFIANQSRAASVASAKWASQQWQEQNSSSIKTLNEIQAEEAEKLNNLRIQQEAEARRRIANNSAMSPLSVIVAKNSNTSGGSVWNNANSQLFANAQKSSAGGGLWDEEDSPPVSTSPSAAISPSSINYKNALNQNLASKNKYDLFATKSVVKNPKLIKKLEVKFG